MLRLNAAARPLLQQAVVSSTEKNCLAEYPIVALIEDSFFFLQRVGWRMKGTGGGGGTLESFCWMLFRSLRPAGETLGGKKTEQAVESADSESNVGIFHQPASQLLESPEAAEEEEARPNSTGQILILALSKADVPRVAGFCLTKDLLIAGEINKDLSVMSLCTRLMQQMSSFLWSC